MTNPVSEIQASYDRVAQQYADEFFGELERKPFDREVLDSFSEGFSEQGLVCEIGCGPGHIARYLKDRGVTVCGIDLSAEMVKSAAHLNPDISFQQGDMLALDMPEASVDGIVSFYSIIHLERKDVPSALKEMNRVLKPGGRLLVSFHGGEGTLHRDEWYGLPVSIDVTLMEKDEMAHYLENSGFEVEQILEREPFEFEYPTPRLYAFARRQARLNR
jgi:SAM-dependent methyltransferase